MLKGIYALETDHSGCCLVGRTGTSDTSYQRFKSSHQHILICCQLNSKDENKETEVVGNGPLKTRTTTTTQAIHRS